ncbi:hypothetical protein TcCL_ESM04926, partial [Trypanosoma cruzi]
TLITMVHNSFANGSLPGSWNTVDTIPIPKPGKDPCRPEIHRTVTPLSVLLNRGMIHRRLSALLPHHPRQIGFTPSRSTSDVVKLVIDKLPVDCVSLALWSMSALEAAPSHDTLVAITRSCP